MAGSSAARHCYTICFEPNCSPVALTRTQQQAQIVIDHSLGGNEKFVATTKVGRPC